jgi:SOS response regulatory protein OraA/RecX
MVKKTNYRDINVLVLINKLENEHKMISAFDEVKNMSRGEAEKYLNHTYFSKSLINKDVFKSKITKSKINIEINIKDLDENIIQMIKSKLNEISKELKNNFQV